MDGNAYLDDTRRRFRELREKCDRALEQVPFERWGERLDPEANSLLVLMLHLSGNMKSRWTDFLSSDGEKPDRDRDTEFEDAALTREQLQERWEHGWSCLFTALDSLADGDLDRTVTIRSRPLSVTSAIQRQLSHYAEHAGQMVLLAKHMAGPAWKTLSIPRGGSREMNRKMMGEGPGR
jgi:hypothetical protein